MNVESTSTISKSTDTSKTSSNKSTTDASVKFKDELESVKSTEAKSAQENKAAQDAKDLETNNVNDAQKVQQEQKASQDNAASQLEKEKLTEEKDEAASSLYKSAASDPLKELNSQIAALKGFNNTSDSKIQNINSKNSESLDGNYCQVMQMNNKDITFFVNLVDNQQMTAQIGQVSNNLNNITNNFTEIKSEATQQTVQVSATLMDAINKSAQTNKPFRIDFGNDIAVIMKVDKEGVLSANFIPGTAAVETYLKNNIASLRQNFDNQNLPYNELSYSNRQKQESQQQKQSNDKENENE